MNIKSLTIYCSSSDNLDLEFYQIAEKIGIFLAQNSIKIIYGGGSVGLMGKISKSAYNSGGEVIGIIPSFLSKKEIINKETTKTIVVKDMTERKKKLFNLGDAFLILPGGSGTIEEATEIISWKFLGLHNKDIIVFNYKGYWDEFFKLYTKAKNYNFGKKNLQDICKHIKTIKEFNYLFH
jgi:hypothetical protein